VTLRFVYTAVNAFFNRTVWEPCLARISNLLVA